MLQLTLQVFIYFGVVWGRQSKPWCDFQHRYKDCQNDNKSSHKPTQKNQNQAGIGCVFYPDPKLLFKAKALFVKGYRRLAVIDLFIYFGQQQ